MPDYNAKTAIATYSGICKIRDKCELPELLFLSFIEAATMKKLFILILVVNFIQSFGQSDKMRKQHFNVKNDIALDGYDPISYFEGTHVEGKEIYRLSFKGIVYQFTSADN